MHRPLPLVLRHHPRQVGASSAAAAPRALPCHQMSPPGPGGCFLVLRTSARVPPGAQEAMSTLATAARPAASPDPRGCRRGFQRAAAPHAGLGGRRRRPPPPPRRTSRGDAATSAPVAVASQECREAEGFGDIANLCCQHATSLL